MRHDNLTLDFSILQGLFWMSMLAHITFAATYMQAVGYTNTGVGIVLAVGNGLAALLGPKLSSMISRGRFKAVSMALLCLFVQLAADIVVLLVGRRCIAFSIAYVVAIAFSFPLNSVELELYSESIRKSIHIDYGVCRGVGSLAFFLLSLAMGPLTAVFPIRIISVAAILLIVLQIVANIAFVSRMKTLDGEDAGKAIHVEEMHALPLNRFFAKYRLYSVMLVGLVFNSVGFRICASYLINIVRNVGGDVSKFSIVNAFNTMMELPVVFLYSKLSRKVDNWVFMAVSLVAFVLKALLLAVAGSVPMIYVAEILQGASYAMNCAAIVPFTTQMIDSDNVANAQSLAFTVNSVGMFIAGILGGVLLDSFGVSQTMWIATGLCFVGCLVAFPCVVALGRNPMAGKSNENKV